MPPLLTWVASFVTCGREVSCSFQEAFPSSRMDRTEKRQKCVYTGYATLPNLGMCKMVLCCLGMFEANEYWYWQNSCRKHELLSLIGDLNPAVPVVAPGRTFLYHLIELSSTVCHMDHYIYSCVLYFDLLRWLAFVHNWNGMN